MADADFESASAILLRRDYFMCRIHFNVAGLFSFCYTISCMITHIIGLNKYKFLAIALLVGIFMLFSAKKTFAYDDIVVVIDPGHGGIVTDTNSNGGCIYNGVYEKDVNLITATALYNELSGYQNVTVYMTRTADVELPLDARIAYAKSVNANVVISVHYNASENHNFYGSEIFTSMYGQPYATGTGLARCIMKQWEDFGSPSKGIKTRKGDKGDYYGLIRMGCDIGMPVIILEHGYLDNDNDFSRMNSIEIWQRLGILDATGIAEYYGFKKDTVREKITPTVNLGSPTNEMSPDNTAPENVKLVVDNYDPETGEVKYSVSASETNSQLMYLGFATGKVSDETVINDLILWDNNKGVQTGIYEVPKGFDGELTVRVYNNYELFTDSTGVKLDSGKDDESINRDSGETDNQDGSEDPGELDGVPGDKGNPETKIIDEIIIGEQAEHIEITPEMVEAAEEANSQKTKAIIGIAIAGSVVILAALIGVTMIVVNAKEKKKDRRNEFDYRRNNI